MKEPKTYRVIVMLRRTRTGYSADVPDLPGCVSTGMTVEHTRHMIAEAIGLHLKGMQEDGDSIPKPRRALEFSIDADAGEELCTWVEVAIPEPVRSSTKAARSKAVPSQR